MGEFGVGAFADFRSFLAFRPLTEMPSRIAALKMDSDVRPVLFEIAAKSTALAISTSARSDANDRP